VLKDGVGINIDRGALLLFSFLWGPERRERTRERARARTRARQTERARGRERERERESKGEREGGREGGREREREREREVRFVVEWAQAHRCLRHRGGTMYVVHTLHSCWTE
jgi:hypothetical protein